MKWLQGQMGLRHALRAAAAVCLISVGLVASPTRAQAEDSQSIIGSTPLKGLVGATDWINSKPLTAKQLKGKVVLVDFWAYSCINCLRSLPYIRGWADKYKDSGLVVIGVHTPEFDFEKQLPNVQKAAKRFNITYPIALDSNQAVWNAFHNRYWPAHYFIDANGVVRFEHFGEGNYEQSEKWIQQLLSEKAAKPMPAGDVIVDAQGIEAPPDRSGPKSPETYIGFGRAQHFASPGGFTMGRGKDYVAPENPGLNEWGLAGKWTDEMQRAVLDSAGGKIIFHFHARDLHLVLGPSGDGKPVRFHVKIDGQAPGDNHGVDINASGEGVVTEHRLYQLVRLNGAVADHIFTIEFDDPGVQAFSFTFG